MAVDPNIKKKADDIRNKIYGKEVRESLASGLEVMSSDVVENEGRQSVVESRQDSVESQWQAVSDEMTDKDVISAPEIIAARNGEANLKTRIDKDHQEVTTQLAHMEIEVFNEIPSTTQLKEGKFGFVIDVAQQQYDDLNLSFERLNANNFPFAFAVNNTGGGVQIVETHLSEIRSTDGTYRSVKVGQKGGVDGSSSYVKLRTSNIIPVDGSKKILKSDLTNFRFSVKPLSANCYDGAGLHMASASVSFRGYNNEVLNSTEASHHFIYDKFPIPDGTTGNKVVLDEWTVVKWDLQEACRKKGVNFDLVAGIVVTFNAYTNHSSASCEFLVDDISFGV